MSELSRKSPPHVASSFQPVNKKNNSIDGIYKHSIMSNRSFVKQDPVAMPPVNMLNSAPGQNQLAGFHHQFIKDPVQGLPMNGIPLTSEEVRGHPANPQQPQQQQQQQQQPQPNTSTSIANTTPATNTPNTTATSPKQKPVAISTTNSNGGPNPTRSSWVWKFFVQTPENPFRVQCQFRPAGAASEICGVVLTRDKTGSTGSMCRHLSRVHQLVPTHTTTTSTSKKGLKPQKPAVSSTPKPTTNTPTPTPTPTTNATNKRRLDAPDSPGKPLKSPPLKKKQKPCSKFPSSSISKPQSNKFTPSYILSNVLPYYIETGIVFYEPDFYRLKAHLLSTLQVSSLPIELQSYPNFCVYAQQKFTSISQDIKSELQSAPGLVSLCCGTWKFEETNATQTTRHVEQNSILVITARYVDSNWSLRRLLLKLIPIKWYTTNVVEIIKQTAIDYDIMGRIFTISIDSSSYSSSFDLDTSQYASSTLPKDSIYYGLDLQLGKSQVDCGMNLKDLVFKSPVAVVSKCVDNVVYDPSLNILPLVVKFETAADLSNDSIPLRQQTDKIIVKEVPVSQDSSASALSADAKKRSERKSVRDYDDDDDEDDDEYEYTMKRLALNGEINNCNKDENDELVGWRSIYMLLKNGLAHLDQVQQFVEISADEHTLLQQVVNVLQPIFTTINDLKISSYDTAGVTAFAIETMIKSVLDIVKQTHNQDQSILTLASDLNKVYKDSLQNNLLFTCIEAMDPNFKRVYWHMDSERQELICQTLIKGVNWVNDKRKQHKFKTASLSENGGSSGVAGNNALASAATPLALRCATDETENEDNASAAVTWNDILPSPVQASFSEFDAGAMKKDTDAADAEGDVDMSELAFGPDDPEKKEICTPTKSTLKSGDELIQLDKEQTAGDESHEEEPSFFRTLVSQEKSIDTLEFEVAEYMRTQTGKKFVDPYHWWKSKGENQFPQLAQLALTYLAIPGWNTVVHNQQLFEGSAVLPCQRRHGRNQVVVVREAGQKEEGAKMVKVLERIKPEQEMCLRYWTRYYHSP